MLLKRLIFGSILIFLICQTSGVGGRSIPWYHGELGDNTNILAFEILNGDTEKIDLNEIVNGKEEFIIFQLKDNHYIVYQGKIYILVKHN